MQHERQALGGRQRLEHDQQRQPDRVGQQRLVLGIESGPARLTSGSGTRIVERLLARVSRERSTLRQTRATTVVSQARRFSISPASERLRRSQASCTASSASLDRAEHPVGDLPQVRPMLLELLGQKIFFVHRSHPFVARVKALTHENEPDVTGGRYGRSNSKIAVTGATGRVGRHIVDLLREQGYEPVPIARSLGVDVITGEGLDEALRGVRP